MQRKRYIYIERLDTPNPFEVIAVLDGDRGIEPISAHPTKRDANAAIKRYEAADKRRAR